MKFSVVHESRPPAAGVDIMKDIGIWVITCGRALLHCVTRAFAADGVIPESAVSLNKFPADHGNALVFLDVCCLGGDMAAGLRSFLAQVRGVSVMAVCDLAKISAAQMAELLNAGADDIIANTIQPELLRAKVGAHMRRLEASFRLEADVVISRDGQLHMDRTCRSIRLVGSDGRAARVFSLTPKEFDLLCLLVRHQGHALRREEILLALWPAEAEDVNSEIISQHIKSLRRKLGPQGRRIKTLYGVGYGYMDAA